MPEYDATTNLQLRRPVVGQPNWGAHLNDSINTLDAAVPFFNVKAPRFGAVGDGSNDDTAEIQAALDLGGVVYFPPGTYKVSSTLLVTLANTILIGAGAEGSTIKAATGLTGAVVRVQTVANTSPVSHAVIRDLGVDGNNIGSATVGIHFRSYQGYIENVQVANCTGNGIHVQGYASWATYDTRIHAVLVKSCDDAGLYCSTRGEDLHVTESIFLTSKYGVRVQAASQQFTNCHFYDNTDYGVFLDGGGTRSKFLGCKIEGSGKHQFVIDGNAGWISDIIIVGCGFATHGTFLTADNTYDALWIGTSGANGTDRHVITGCEFMHQTNNKHRYGVNLANAGAQVVTIAGCTFGQDSHWGTSQIGVSSSIATANKPRIIGNSSVDNDLQGTATVANGATTAVVTHGLAFTPDAQDISVTPTNNLGNASQFWITSVGATTFTITVDTDPGASTATFVWQARVF